MGLKKLKIGDIELENNLILAPMAGITDLPFRMITKKYGNPGLVCGEMVSSKAIHFQDAKTLKMLRREGEQGPISMQIFGSEPEIMGEAAALLAERADIVDINMGCPAPKVVKNGDGSKLLLDLDLAEEVIRSVVQKATRPVTLKIRKGWDSEHIVAVELARIAEKCGIAAVTVHGRTRTQQYTGAADLEIIREVKQAVKIPVIGNGDINSAQDAKKMFEQTGCDGIMIGRGALGNPWIFSEITSYFKENREYKGTSALKKFQAIQEHFELLLKEKGEYTAVREMRKHIAWYVKGMKNATVVRERINKVESKQAFYQEIEKYFEGREV